MSLLSQTEVLPTQEYSGQAATAGVAVDEANVGCTHGFRMVMDAATRHDPANSSKITVLRAEHVDGVADDDLAWKVIASARWAGAPNTGARADRDPALMVSGSDMAGARLRCVISVVVPITFGCVYEMHELLPGMVA